MRILLSLFLVFLSACASTDMTAYKSSLHTKIGTGHLEQNNIPAAFRELQIAVQLDPNNVVALNNLGLAYKARKMPKEALESLDKALKVQPAFTDAKINKAIILVDENRFSEAIEILKESSNDLTYQEPEKAFSQLGFAYYKMQNYKEALKTFERALYFNPQHCFSKKYYGLSLYYSNQFKNSIKSMEQSLFECTAKKNPELFYYLGMSYYKLGEIEKAKARLSTLVKEYSENENVPAANEILELMQ